MFTTDLPSGGWSVFGSEPAQEEWGNNKLKGGF